MVDELLKPTRLWRERELWQGPDSPPFQPGVYAWYFDQVPGGTPTKGCRSVDGCWLLYVGISPARPGSKQHLRKRLRQHLRGNARGSTLRKTLGCLLTKELGLEFRRTSEKSAKFTGDGEAALSSWMAKHARVVWYPTPEPWIDEARLIGDLSLPLNLRGNEEHSFYPTLSRRRAEMVARAMAMPILGA